MKNRILDAAQELFITKGYEAVSTGDLLKKAGIARQTLYNHFGSREDVLDGVIERMIGRMSKKAGAIAFDHSKSVLVRLSETIMAFQPDSSLHDEMLEQMHRPHNALMHQKMQQKLLSAVTPFLIQIVNEGKKEGIFHTDYPEQALEMILLYSSVVFDDLSGEPFELRQRRAEGFVQCCERLLGTKPGVLAGPIAKMMENGAKASGSLSQSEKQD